MSEMNEIVPRTENLLTHPPSMPSDREDKATFDMNEIVPHTENLLTHPPPMPSDREDKAMFDKNKTVTCRINNVLDGLSSMLPDGLLPRVPNHLRGVNKKAYEPNIISIGPYHRGKRHLAIMEEYKFGYLKLLKQRDESSITRYVEALIKLDERAKNCYEKQFRKERKVGDFLETMLVDGCFILGLICKDVAKFIPHWNESSLIRDLLLLENQLPFFILQELFNMTSLSNESSNLEDRIIWFFGKLLGPGCKGSKLDLPKAPVHLLGLMHDYWLPSPAGMMTDPNRKGQEEQRTNDAKVPTELHEAGIKLSINCGLIIDCGLICRKKASKEDDAEAHIPCATRLHEAGIEFKKVEGCSIFNIKFAKGVLEIPKLRIEDNTESLLRNLIAYEQFWEDDTPVTDYARFMDWLINSDKDVELLCCSGIIDNWLGNDEVIATMFNRLSDNVTVGIRPIYSEIYKKVDKHYGRKWNLWKAKLRHDYFNGPWALISFLAAVFLLLLTVLQSVCSVLSVHHS